MPVVRSRHGDNVYVPAIQHTAIVADQSCDGLPLFQEFTCTQGEYLCINVRNIGDLGIWARIERVHERLAPPVYTHQPDTYSIVCAAHPTVTCGGNAHGGGSKTRQNAPAIDNGSVHFNPPWVGGKSGRILIDRKDTKSP
jgi:hypothetical protein